jgi:hypothetical protein
MLNVKMMVDSIPGTVQLAGDHRRILHMFKDMSDEDILIYSAKLDDYMAKQHREVGSTDYAEAFEKRAAAVRNVLRRLDERANAGGCGERVQGSDAPSAGRHEG